MSKDRKKGEYISFFITFIFAQRVHHHNTCGLQEFERILRVSDCCLRWHLQFFYEYEMNTCTAFLDGWKRRRHSDIIIETNVDSESAFETALKNLTKIALSAYFFNKYERREEKETIRHVWDCWERRRRWRCRWRPRFLPDFPAWKWRETRCRRHPSVPPPPPSPRERLKGKEKMCCCCCCC